MRRACRRGRVRRSWSSSQGCVARCTTTRTLGLVGPSFFPLPFGLQTTSPAYALRWANGGGEISWFLPVANPPSSASPPAQAVDSVLNRLPAGSRTAYARTMASVRSQFHLDSEIRRRASVESALAAARPGQLIMDTLRISEGGTVAMRSPRARKERAERLRGFIRAHCLKGLPGTLPFFKSLYAVLFLQGRKAERGGAGKRRVEWEVDVAVFSEAGGGTWMVDSIECLKSVSFPFSWGLWGRRELMSFRWVVGTGVHGEGQGDSAGPVVL